MNRVHFISYPKSGRTWLRFILFKLEVADQIHFHHDLFEFNDSRKLPHNFDLLMRKNKYANEKVIYLERDPRDVMVSLYFQVTGRFKDFFHYKKGVGDFIRDEYFGATNLKKFRDIWAILVKENNFLKITYEEGHQNMNDVITSILEYMQIQKSKEEILEAINSAEFSQMKKIENNNKFDAPWLQKRQGHNKVRKGQIGGYKNYLSQDDIFYLDNIFNIVENN